MDYSKSLEVIIDGDAVLFLGSGASMFAYNKFNEELKSGKSFANYLYSLCNEDSEDGDLLDAGQLAQKTLGESELIKVIQEQFIVKGYNDIYKQMYSVKWDSIFTTNYDNLVEQVISDSGEHISSFTLANNPESVNKNFILHINGYACDLDVSNYGKTFKLSKTDYYTDTFTDSKWHNTFVNKLRYTSALFFVGYSMYDLNIAKILISEPYLQERCFFITEPNPSNKIIRTFEPFGKIIDIGVQEFANNLEKKKKTYSPKTAKETVYSFELNQRLLEKDLKTEINAQDIFDLMVYGKYNHNIHWSIKEDRYLFPRTECDQIISSIKDGENNFLIEGNLGTGKTIILELLFKKLFENGIKAYKYIKNSNTELDDLKIIFKNEEPVAILIDNYSKNFDLIEMISNNKRESDILILTERTILNEINSHKLNDFENYNVINIDILSEQSIYSLVSYTSKHGLLGERAGKDDHVNAFYVRDEIKGSLCDFLIEIIKSKSIKKRIESLYLELKRNEQARKLVLASLIFSKINIWFDVYLLKDIFPDIDFNDSIFRSTPQLNQFITFSSNNFKEASSVLSKYILNEYESSNNIKEILIQIYKRASELASGRNIYANILRDLIHAGTVRLIFPDDKNKNDTILQYYEAIKDLSGESKRPLFWLQYAIAMLDIKRYDIAERLFATSYALARSKTFHFDVYQIDNHYARYLLEKAINDKNGADPDDIIKKAHHMIIRQLNDHSRDHSYYPYNKAIKYKDYYIAFKDKMNKDIIKNYAAEILEKIKNLEHKKSRLARNQHINSCKNSMLFILNN